MTESVVDYSEQPLAVEVDDVTMIFNMASESLTNLKEYFIKLAKHELFFEEFRALKHISFDIHRGEVVGLVGTNGSGKSTILKIITGVLNPTGGSVHVNGRISALLELGAGFNMEYNGIENIYLNGTMIGFSKKEIDAKMDDILNFADIGDMYISQSKPIPAVCLYGWLLHCQSMWSRKSSLWMRPFLWETCSSSLSATAAWRRSGRTEPPFLWLPTTWAVSSNTVTGWCF